MLSSKAGPRLDLFQVLLLIPRVRKDEETKAPKVERRLLHVNLRRQSPRIHGDILKAEMEMRCLSFGFGLCFAGACRIFRDQSSVFVPTIFPCKSCSRSPHPTPKFLHDSTYLHDHAHTVRRSQERALSRRSKGASSASCEAPVKTVPLQIPFCFARAFVVDERAVQVEDNRLNLPLQHGYALGIWPPWTKPCAPFVEPTAKTTAADYRGSCASMA